ncbi:hypothetical protein HDU84_004581 [Entophlyctis sp. JEL0112]|nr:hypothetical protein HDU84_004581 [Entophlyctis sp. JEL0112]
MADRVVHAALTFHSLTTVPAATAAKLPLLDYLVQCWRRANEARRRVMLIRSEKAPSANLASADAAALETLVADRVTSLEAVRAMIVSYAGIVLNPEVAELYPQNQEIVSQGAGYMASKLLVDSYSAEEALPAEFLKEFIARFQDDGLVEFFGPVINSVSAAMRLKDITMNDFATPIRVLTTLVAHKPVATVLINMPNFMPNIPGNQPRLYELLTILGPFFAKPCVFDDEAAVNASTGLGKVASTYFPSTNPLSESGNVDREGRPIGERNYGDVTSVMSNLRGLISTVQAGLYDLTMTLIKSGAESREAVLKFLAEAITLNVARGKMQVDRKTAGTDGFMFNVVKVCLRLCEPITDSAYSKIHLIEPFHFLRPNPRLPQPPSTTMMNSDDEQLAAQRAQWLAQNSSTGPANFVTDVFVLTLGALHFGYMSSVRALLDVDKNITEAEREISRMRADRDSGAWAGSADGARREFMYKRYLMQTDIWIANRLVLTTSLLDKTTVDQVMRFYDLVMMWLIRVILVGSGKNVTGVDWAQLARGNYSDFLPFPDDVPALFATLPEWIFEDVVEFYVFVARFKATLFENTMRDEFMLFSVAMLQSSGYIKNPHLKSKLVEVSVPIFCISLSANRSSKILYYFTLPLYRMPSGEPTGPQLDSVFSTHEAAKKFLVPGVMRFYVDAEFTGASSAFYDKFNIRYNISQILKNVWDDPSHRNAMIQESQREEFIKFANLLMNDTSYLLDESLGKLADIHRVQEEMDNPVAWGALDQAARDERQGTLRTYERAAMSYVSLCRETVDMFRYLTSDERIVTPFMAPYIVERLAAMLDYNLATLVGPKCTELKVKNPQKYRFNPKELLKNIVDIYVHLSHRNEFVEAIARDERSYRKETFDRAIDILFKFKLTNSGEVDILRMLANKVEEVIRNTQAEDEELGDIPLD